MGDGGRIGLPALRERFDTDDDERCHNEKRADDEHEGDQAAAHKRCIADTGRFAM